jgi:ABC-2 type transport system ATP-binding protein
MNVLELHDVSKRFGELSALDGLSFDVKAGEIHAIVGLNGAGKTTAMRSVVGHSQPDQGSVSLFGVDITRAGPDEYARLGFVIDEVFAYPEQTVRANITFAARLHGVTRVDGADAANAWIDRLELGRWADRRAGGLSLGNRQRSGLACVLAHAPDLLILDEPTNALDPAGVLLLRDVLLERAASGTGVLVSSHHLDEVSRIAHRITVIHAGQVVGSLAPGQVDLEHRFFEVVRAWDAGHPEPEQRIA